MNITLKSSHLYLTADTVKKVFGEDEFVFVKYISETNKILLAPVTSAWFAKMYKPDQYMLKVRNKNGDKTLAVKPIFIDHDVNMEDRNLPVAFMEKTMVVKISL